MQHVAAVTAVLAEAVVAAVRAAAAVHIGAKLVFFLLQFSW